MRVEASGYQFIFPQQCACCEANPDTYLTVSASKSSGQKVVRTKTNTWDFPYCSKCKEHIDAAYLAKVAAWAVGRKLINLSPAARGLLDGAGYEHRANNVQSAKRYRK